MLKQLVVPAA